MKHLQPDLPPVIQITADEQLWRFDRPDDLRRFLQKRGLLKELRRQASWTLEEFGYVNRAKDLDRGDGLIVTATGSLDPFHDGGKCIDISCRTKLARDFVQSAAMFADVTLITDSFTSIFDSDGKWSDRRFEELFTRIQLLRMALPLINAGLLRLGSPVRYYCSACYERSVLAVDAAVKDLLSAAEKDITADYHGNDGRGVVAVSTAVLSPQSDHPLHHIVELNGERHLEYLRACGNRSHSRKSRQSRQFLAQLVKDELEYLVRHALFDVSLAGDTHSLLLAGGRLEPLMLSSLDKRFPPVDQLAEWERVRTLELPWLSDLTAEELLRLREEASIALPRLRELIFRRVVSGEAPADGADLLRELKDQAYRVEDELSQLPLASERRYRVGTGALAMLLVVYGVGTGRPELITASMATLLASLAHLRSAEREHEGAVKRLSRQPGYALLKGKQMIEQRGKVRSKTKSRSGAVL